jgi:predicted nuclease of predicted toxin-antitoxin system
MRLLANENFPRLLVVALRQAGHDVASVREAYPGVSDVEVLGIAGQEARIVATFDKDFGALAFRAGMPAPAGIILIRIDPRRSVIASQVVAALAAECPWAGHLATVEPGRIRLRALPRR